MSDVVHAIDMKSVITSSVIGLILGAILTFVPMSSLVGIIIVVISILMIATNGYYLYLDMYTKKDSNNQTLLYVIGILLGFILLCFPNLVMQIIVAIYLIADPLIKMYKAKWNKNILFANLPKLTLGVILLVSGISTFDIIFKVLGVIVLIGSLLYLGINYYFYKKSGVKIIK